MPRVLYFIPLVFFIFSTKLFAANVDIPLHNPIYFEIDRLRSLGYLESLTTLTKPYTTQELKEALSEIESDIWAAKVTELLHEIKRYETNGVLDTSSSFYYANADMYVRNNEGLSLLKEESGFEVSARLQYLLAGGFSFVATPSYRNTIDEDSIFMKDTYVRYSFYNLAFTAGRQSLWWGPGKHGTLLLSDNAKPIDMIRLSNDKALKFDALSFLGSIDFDMLLGVLGEYYGIVNPDAFIESGYPKIFAMQLSIAPSPYFQLGAYRTAIFGGADRPEDLSTIWNVIFPFGDVENLPGGPGDQKAGLTAKISVPNNVQSFALYGEAAGEDESRNMPSKWSFIGGMDVVDLANTKGLNLNLEYMQMSDTDVWYKHHLYLTEYTNKGFIVGHAHGGIGKELDIELTYQQDLISTFEGGYRREIFADDVTADTLYFTARYRLGDQAEFRADFSGSSTDADIDDDFYGTVKLNYTYLLW